jgi:hypothetical protein
MVSMSDKGRSSNSQVFSLTSPASGIARACNHHQVNLSDDRLFFLKLVLEMVNPELAAVS